MKILNLVLMGSLLCAVSAQAEDDVKTQADYDKEVAESLQKMTSELQMKTDELVKYMSAVNKALNETMPQFSNSMGKLISSMKPIAETMQQNLDHFAEEVNLQLDEEANEGENDTPPLPQQISESEDEVISEMENVSSEIEAELAQFEDFPSARPAKIKLFPQVLSKNKAPEKGLLFYSIPLKE